MPLNVFFNLTKRRSNSTSMLLQRQKWHNFLQDPRTTDSDSINPAYQKTAIKNVVYTLQHGSFQNLYYSQKTYSQKKSNKTAFFYTLLHLQTLLPSDLYSFKLSGLCFFFNCFHSF